MAISVGLDCGGSSCRVTAVDADGEIVFQGQSGATNLVSTPELKLKKHLQLATRGCPTAQFVCGCFAGLVDDEARERAIALLRPLFPTAHIRAVPDFHAALYASPAESVATVIAGTGSLVCSVVGDAVRKSGGRGYLLGDEGSASRYGRAGMRSFLDDPENASDALVHAIRQTFATLDPGPLVAAVYRSGTPAGMLARLARAVGADARDGRPYAVRAVEEETGELVAIVARHLLAHHADAAEWVVCLAGGLWKGPNVYRDAFDRHLAVLAEGRVVTTVRPVHPPIFGAVRLAKEMQSGHRK